MAGELSAYSRSRSTFAVMPSMHRSARRRLTCAEEADRLEDVAADHRQHHVELEVARRTAPCHRGVVADDLGARHQGRLGNDGVHLARHDAAPRLEVGEVDLAEAGARAGSHPAQVVGDLRQADRDGPQLARQLDEGVPGALRLEVVARLGEGQAGRRCDFGDHPTTEARRRVDAGPDRRAAERELGDPRERRHQPLDTVADLGRVPAELLAEGHRRCVHEVRAARLHDIGELVALAFQRGGEVLERRESGRERRRPSRRRGSRPETCRSTTADG